MSRRQPEIEKATGEFEPRPPLSKHHLLGEVTMSNDEYNTKGPKFPVPVVFEKDGRVWASSRDVAEFFGKRHKNVLQSIDNLECSKEFRRLNFQHTPYVEPQNGQTYKMYEMTKDGFAFLVMGFTGSDAAKFKEAYIAQFNAMEAVIHEAANIIKCSPRESRLLFKDALSYAKLGGLKGNQALIAANQLTRKVSGIGFLEEMGMAHIPAESEERLLTPSEIGIRLGGKSAIWVNQRLAELGYQVGHRDKKGRPYWEATEKGQEFARLMDTSKRHGDGTMVQQLKWLSGVIDLLRETA